MKTEKLISYDTSLIKLVNLFTDSLYENIFVWPQGATHYSASEALFHAINERTKTSNSLALWEDLSSQFTSIRKDLDQDALEFEKTDPAVHSLEEVYLAYPGFYAIVVYRLAHKLYEMELYTFARMMSECAHRTTGIDIHPGAQIGVPFYIDHGTGVVIGQTTIIKNRVKIYQGVTLGGLQVKKQLAKTKRHPTVEDNVTIYANATILGGEVVIGENSIIGANVWISESVPKNSIVQYKSEIKIHKNERI
ncbi:serine O-acetyltransferase [Lishizhenia tianjinensis]|uniref:Serine O-acetyltransferase n=1 Tax=Lishizhenia tianjinensis TaxID=477690 RepID=A0A1I6YE81_9FLAO|nr:serine O-acetyltransferase EpsC [Lishizhenia tianjinensis]SFT48514.1 serine O-acetyltransferase [Lishizhenia tianjinensis]